MPFLATDRLWHEVQKCLNLQNIQKSNKRKWFHIDKGKKQTISCKTIIDANYIDDLALLINRPAQAESLLYSLEQAAGSTDLYMNVNKTEFMCFKQKGAISTLSDKPLKLMDQFTYISSNNSSTKNVVNIYLAKPWNAIFRLSIIWKSNLSNKIKWNFFKAVAVSKVLYGCTT